MSNPQQLISPVSVSAQAAVGLISISTGVSARAGTMRTRASSIKAVSSARMRTAAQRQAAKGDGIRPFLALAEGKIVECKSAAEGNRSVSKRRVGSLHETA